MGPPASINHTPSWRFSFYLGCCCYFSCKRVLSHHVSCFPFSALWNRNFRRTDNNVSFSSSLPVNVVVVKRRVINTASLKLSSEEATKNMTDRKLGTICDGDEDELKSSTNLSICSYRNGDEFWVWRTENFWRESYSWTKRLLIILEQNTAESPLSFRRALSIAHLTVTVTIRASGFLWLAAWRAHSNCIFDCQANIAAVTEQTGNS